MCDSNIKGLNLLLPVIFTGILFLSACENDLKKIKEITDPQITKPIERTTGVEVIYSDSAKVKARMVTPLLLHYLISKPYYEMPKGVTVYFFDENMKESSNIKADYALQREKEKIIELHKNVVATNAKGETFKSDELIWDQNKKEVHSNKLVQITMANGNVMNGTSFKSDESLTHWYMNQSTGKINVNQGMTQ